MVEPLLPSPTRRRRQRTRQGGEGVDEQQPRQQPRYSPPQHAFLLSPDRQTPLQDEEVVDDENVQGSNNTSGNDEDATSDGTIDVFHLMCRIIWGNTYKNYLPQEQDHQQLRCLRRVIPESSSSTTRICIRDISKNMLFWCFMILIAIVLGLVMGLLSVSFVAIHQIIIMQWFHVYTHNNSTNSSATSGYAYSEHDNDNYGNDNDYSSLPTFSILGTEWDWVIITSLGGLVSGILLLVSENNSRNGGLGSVLTRTSTTILNGENNSIASLVCHDSLLVLCSLITLIAGIPLGTFILLMCQVFYCCCFSLLTINSPKS